MIVRVVAYGFDLAQIDAGFFQRFPACCLQAAFARIAFSPWLRPVVFVLLRLEQEQKCAVVGHNESAAVVWRGTIFAPPLSGLSFLGW
jgi:hypothetical protein